ncbi:UBX domain-containing protein 11 isoform X2 [Bombina bombina]|uniref:UBX domain-containing protein 11 isoform X2 n=1 Tax=Bombina bombina TaxID=8345 RepID=UPI00235AD0CC|nr:UBX domain-containing protein 11 isoform X2 [Bombina bombina]
MSDPLITLSKPRKARMPTGGILPGMSHTEGGISPRRQTEENNVAPSKHLRPLNIHARKPHEIGKRAAPFKIHEGCTEELLLIDGLPSHPMGSSEKIAPSLLSKIVQGTGPSDFDLLSTTMRRIGELERKVQLQEREIQHKDQEIAVLTEKIKKLQKHKTEPSNLGNQTKDLEKKCEELQQRVKEMERFLGDYGLIWVGENNVSKAPELDHRIHDPDFTSSASFKPDFDVILENLRDLNVLGGEGESQIVYRDGGARLKNPEAIPLTLYRNGIIMFRGPFRSYHDPSTQQCLKDIMDGFFPSELQSHFPDGVTFQVTDKRDMVFRERQPWNEFPGHGQTVGSSEEKLLETTDVAGPQLTVEQFLNKLPKTVVRGGQVLDIRKPIRDVLQGSGKDEKPQEILVESPKLFSTEERSQQHVAITTLRIKSESGNDTYKVRMLPTETIGDLRIFLAQYRSTALSSYDIVGRFPHRVYDEDTCTLQELGLIPNASLLLRTKTAEKVKTEQREGPQDN